MTENALGGKLMLVARMAEFSSVEHCVLSYTEKEN
jgi:hypothetical protein